ncbi:DNA topoisomerase I, partial [Methanothrix sp.]
MHLIIAEKHDAARRISEILAGKKPAVARVSGVDTFRFDDRVVIGLSGHIVGLDYPESYNNWQRVDYRDLIRAEIVSKPTQERIVSALRKLGMEADHVTIATDYDREGELIGVEALRILQEVNPSVKADRVRFSAITKSEILRAFAQPGEVDFNLAASGEARQIIDLVWGAALTRFISITSGRLGKEFLSVGRVQSPTLALIVDREKEIESFQPKPYWEIYADLERGIRARHAKSRIWNRDEVDRILNSLSDVARVRSISRGERRDRPPTPFDTTSFISAASSIGFTAANAMRIAEDLYTNGYISYPRTDNTVYPPSIDLRSLLEMLSSGPFREDALELMKGSLIPTRGKRSTTDHPPIYPTSVADKNDLKEDQWRIYELVVRRFFATLSGECVWETTSVSFDIGDELFRANGSRILDQGWRRYYPYSRAEENVLPPIEEGEELRVLGHEVLSKETQPPARFGHGRLVRLMDELGLGT